MILLADSSQPTSCFQPDLLLVHQYLIDTFRPGDVRALGEESMEESILLGPRDVQALGEESMEESILLGPGMRALGEESMKESILLSRRMILRALSFRPFRHSLLGPLGTMNRVKYRF